jgi:hypothetical protein
MQWMDEDYCLIYLKQDWIDVNIIIESIQKKNLHLSFFLSCFVFIYRMSVS